MSIPPIATRLCLWSGLVLAGFIAGRLYQHARTGWHSRVLAEERFGEGTNVVLWRCVTESVGMPFLDPGTTSLEYRGRTIYKAKRHFQESFPVAAHVAVSNRTVTWDDGEFRFKLRIEDVRGGEP